CWPRLAFDRLNLHPPGNRATGDLSLGVGVVVNVSVDMRVRSERECPGPRQDLTADGPADLQRAAAGGDSAADRAERADRFAGRDQAAANATTRANVDLLGQAGDAVVDAAVDRDHPANGAHIAG